MFGRVSDLSFFWDLPAHKTCTGLLNVGEQNLPPQNVSLASRLLQAENHQDSKDKGRYSDITPNCIKEFGEPVAEYSYHLVYLQRIWDRCARGNSTEPRDQSPLCVPLSLLGPANICLPNICFSSSVSVAFLPFEVPNHYPEYPLLSIAEVSI